MKINFFEGARRIALAIGVLWTVGCLAYAVFTKPYVSLTFAVKSYGAPPIPAERCEPRDVSKYTTVDTPKGKQVAVTLCFIADRDYTIQHPDGRELILTGPDNATAEQLKDAAQRAFDGGAGKLPTEAAAAGPAAPETAFQGVQNKGQVVRDAMAGESDRKVRGYVDKLAARFALQPIDLERFEKVQWQKRWELWKETLQFLFGGLLVGWVLMAVFGWVVRGFLGIPRGRDSRPVA